MAKQHQSKRKQTNPYLEQAKIAFYEEHHPKGVGVLYLIALLIVFIFGWAYYAKIDKTTVAAGRVIPSSRIQVVQNLEGGIVKDILVTEGQIVQPGELLIRLDDTQFSAAYQRDLAKKAVLQAEIARLAAEANAAETIEFPEQLIKQFPARVAHARELFTKNRQSLAEQLKILEQSYDYTEQELNVIAPLAKKGVMSKIDIIRLQKMLNDIRGQIVEKQDQFQAEARQQLNKAKGELAILNETLVATKDRKTRTELLSPVHGIVNKIHISTIGEVIDSGMKIVEIVPIDDNLTIKAFIKPQDIGFVHPGQGALVKVSAYPFTTYGGLKAKLISISADAFTNKKGKSFYEVKLKTEKNHLGSSAKPLPIIPGMTVNVSIITGQQSILTYLLKPLRILKQQAFRED